MTLRLSAPPLADMPDTSLAVKVGLINIAGVKAAVEALSSVQVVQMLTDYAEGRKKFEPTLGNKVSLELVTTFLDLVKVRDHDRGQIYILALRCAVRQEQQYRRTTVLGRLATAIWHNQTAGHIFAERLPFDRIIKLTAPSDTSRPSLSDWETSRSGESS